MDACQTASLGVGFSYEEVFEMCQEVAKLEGEKSRSNMSKMSTISMDSNHHVVDMEDSCVDLEVIRRRLRFRNTVSVVSRNTVSELSEDEGKILMDRTRQWTTHIIGGRTEVWTEQERRRYLQCNVSQFSSPLILIKFS